MKFANFSSLIPTFVLVTLVQVSLGQNFPRDYVNAHNVARAKMGLGRVVWDPRLAAYAQSYANLRAIDCKLVHSNTDYGENIAKGWGPIFAGVTAVGLWVNEKPYYDYKLNTCVGGVECLHYTQIIWRESTHIGCARVQCKNSNWFFVTCNYNPSGNYEDERPY